MKFVDPKTELTLAQALQQAIDHHRAGQLSEAQQLYRAILEVEPNHADANHNLGVLLTALKQTAAALPLFKLALETQPRVAKFWFSYIDALIQENQLDTARSLLAQGQKLGLKGEKVQALASRLFEPAQAELEQLQALFNQSDYAAAQNLAENLIHRFPLQGGLWKFLGSILQATGQVEASVMAKKKSVELLPDDAEAFYNLGNGLKSLEQFKDAESCYRQAITLNPQDAASYNNLGIVLQELARFQEAADSYQQAITLKPDSVEAYNNLGATLKELGRLPEAETHYRQALALAPQYAEAHNNLGILLQELNRLQEAECSYRAALAFQPNLATAHGNLGRVLKDQGRLAEAEQAYQTALALEPDLAKVHSNLLFAYTYRAEHSPEFRLAQAKHYGARMAKKVSQKFTTWHCQLQPKKLRIGFVSGDFCQHVVSYFLETLLSALDSTKIELFAYYSFSKVDAVTERLQGYFVQWQSLVGLTDEAAAQLIHQDGVHILFDLSGHTAENRLPVFAYKPAPIQVTWLGYWATTGLAEMDMILVDKIGVPEQNQHHFVEKVCYLPDTRLCFSAPTVDIAVSPLPALHNGYLTFGCFQNLTKVTDAVLATWGKIAAQLPSAHWHFQSKQLADADFKLQFYQRLARHGINTAQVTSQGFVSREAYFAAHQYIDIILDTFPYTGGTTTCEALWMGVPTLTLVGNSLLARQGASLLAAAGLADWIVENEANYIKQVVVFANDLENMANLRHGLREQVLASPLFNAAQFAQHFSRALWEIWQENNNIERI